MSSESLSHSYLERLDQIMARIGDTPLLEVRFRYEKRPMRLFAKTEHSNFSGSVKDRMVANILKAAFLRGELTPEAHLIEATSGNTGIALAAIGRALGHSVTIFMPDWLSRERVDLMRSYGAKIVLVSREEGGFLGAIAKAKALHERLPGSFLANQFSNPDNVEAHFSTTGPEIADQLAKRGLVADAFVAGVGTGGVIMGTGRYLKRINPKIRLHPLEPASSPTLSTGYKCGSHRIEGISDEFIPSILDLDALDEVICVEDGDAILMAQRFRDDLGFGVGISSGANFLGALKVLLQMPQDSTVVTIFTDDEKKYLSTDLYKEEPSRPDYLTPRVELLSIAEV